MVHSHSHGRREEPQKSSSLKNASSCHWGSVCRALPEVVYPSRRQCRRNTRKGVLFHRGLCLASWETEDELYARLNRSDHPTVGQSILDSHEPPQLNEPRFLNMSAGQDPPWIFFHFAIPFRDLHRPLYNFISIFKNNRFNHIWNIQNKNCFLKFCNKI